MLTTTLNRIRNHNPCQDVWEKLLKHLGKTQADDEPLPYSVIFESNGIEDALWCCRAEPKYDKQWRTFTLWCARQVQHLMKDERSIKCLDTVQDFIDGKASEKELDDARASAISAARDAYWAAYFVALDTYSAASRVASSAAFSAVFSAVFSATSNSASSISAYWAASRTASSAASRAAQTKKFLEIVK